MKYLIEITGSDAGARATVTSIKPTLQVVCQPDAGKQFLDDPSFYVWAATSALLKCAVGGDPNEAAINALGLILAALQRLHETGDWGLTGASEFALDYLNEAVDLCHSLTGETKVLIKDTVWEAFSTKQPVEGWVIEKLHAEILRLRWAERVGFKGATNA